MRPDASDACESCSGILSIHLGPRCSCHDLRSMVCWVDRKPSSFASSIFFGPLKPLHTQHHRTVGPSDFPVLPLLFPHIYLGMASPSPRPAQHCIFCPPSFLYTQNKHIPRRSPIRCLTSGNEEKKNRLLSFWFPRSGAQNNWPAFSRLLFVLDHLVPRTLPL